MIKDDKDPVKERLIQDVPFYPTLI